MFIIVFSLLFFFFFGWLNICLLALFISNLCTQFPYINHVADNTNIFLPRDLDFLQYLHTEEARIQDQPPVDSIVPDLVSFHRCFCSSTPRERSRSSVWQENRNRLQVNFILCTSTSIILWIGYQLQIQFNIHEAAAGLNISFTGRSEFC